MTLLTIFLAFMGAKCVYILLVLLSRHAVLQRGLLQGAFCPKSGVFWLLFDSVFVFHG